MTVAPLGGDYSGSRVSIHHGSQGVTPATASALARKAIDRSFRPGNSPPGEPKRGVLPTWDVMGLVKLNGRVRPGSWALVCVAGVGLAACAGNPSTPEERPQVAPPAAMP